MDKFTVTLARTDSDTGGTLTIQRAANLDNKPIGPSFKTEINDMNEVIDNLSDWIGDNCEDLGEMREDADEHGDEADASDDA